jgi:hypothetical protein
MSNDTVLRRSGSPRRIDLPLEVGQAPVDAADLPLDRLHVVEQLPVRVAVAPEALDGVEDVLPRRLPCSPLFRRPATTGFERLALLLLARDRLGLGMERELQCRRVAALARLR